jgi:hypothetical protein
MIRWLRDDPGGSVTVNLVVCDRGSRWFEEVNSGVEGSGEPLRANYQETFL